jgi:hypothetical protein
MVSITSYPNILVLFSFKEYRALTAKLPAGIAITITPNSSQASSGVTGDCG